MTDTDSKKPAPVPRGRIRKWLKRIGLTLFALVALLVVFHRPILSAVIRVVALKVAAQQHIRLGVEVGGSFISDITLRNFRAVPDGTGPSPVERIEAESITVDYDLIGLARHGLAGLLKSCSLKNAYVAITPPPAKVPPPPKEKENISSTLGGIFRQTALVPGSVDIENVTLIVHSPDGDLQVKGLSLSLDTEKEGVLQFEHVQIPHFHAYDRVAATTSFTGRNLVIRNLLLDQDLQIRQIALDASRRAENINILTLDAQLFGSQTSLSLNVHQVDKDKADIRLAASIQGLGFKRPLKYLNVSAPVDGTINQFSAALTGDPDIPSSLNGTINLQAGPITSGTITLDRLNVNAVAADGAVKLSPAEAVLGGNTVSITAASRLPRSTADFAQMELDSELHVDAKSLGALAPQVTAGTVAVDGTVSMHGGLLQARLNTTATGIATGTTASLSSAAFEITARKSMAGQKKESPFYEGLRAEVSGSFSGIGAANYAIDSGALDLRTENDHVTLEKLLVQRADNLVHAGASYVLPADGDYAKAPFQASFDITAPNLTAFNAEPTLVGVNGEFTANGKISGRGNLLDGNITLSGTNLRFQELSAQSLDVRTTIEKSVARIDAMQLRLNGTDGVTATGTVRLQKPISYDAQLGVAIRDLAIFNPFLQAAGQKQKLAGSLEIGWKGKGDLDKLQHEGEVSIDLKRGQFGDFKPVEAAIHGNYSPDAADIPVIRVTTPLADLLTAIQFKDRQLRVTSLSVTRGKTALLSGTISLPLDLRNAKNPEALIPPDQPIAVTLVSKDLDIAPFLAKGKEPSPATGLFTTTLTASGSLDQLAANLQVQGRNIKSAAAAKLSAAALNLDLAYSSDRLTLSGTVSQPLIKSLEINGAIPLPLKKLLQEKKLDDQTPVQLSVKLPPSSTNFISSVVPAIRFAQGQVGIDANVRGTIAKPDLSGSGMLNIDVIHFLDPTLPAVTGFRGDLRFAKNELTINHFGGDISGGPFDVTGKITLANLLAPVLSLHITSKEALLVRNDSLTVRANSDVKVEGPFNAAYVSGTVEITRSKFFREVDLLPIELPGRPAPKPPVNTSPGISLGPPLRDWTFNVAIKTKDPFLIRGNLTDGAAIVDLLLDGTGMTPGLDGDVQIENFVASLPFSKLNITNGFVYFSSDDPFVPTLDIQGTSNMRDYNISVYISGTPSDPSTVFTSEPPLPQEDIIALLATGATTQELTGPGGSDVLAGRAAVLVFQKFYRKIFKKKEPSENESFADRLNVDVGAVDPRTGRQELSAKFKLTDHFDFIGDLDVQGSLRGQVKYLIRFR